MTLRKRFLAAAVACIAAASLLVTATAAGAASKAKDLKTARAGVLVSGDFPTGWSGSRNPASSDDEMIKAAKKIASCRDYVKLRTTTATLPEARSLAFDDGAGTTASNVVNVFSSTAKANASMKLWASTTMPTCLEKFTQLAVGDAATVTVDTTDVSALGEDAVGYTAAVSDDTGTVVQELLSIAVPVGRFVSVYTLSAQSEATPVDVLEAAVESSLTRLDDAVNS